MTKTNLIIPVIKQNKHIFLGTAIGVGGIFLILLFVLKKEHKHDTRPVVVTRTPTQIPVIRISQPSIDTSAWITYSDPVLNFSITYPPTVMLDPGEPFSTSFIFKDKDWHTLPRNSRNYEALTVWQRSTKLDSLDTILGESNNNNVRRIQLNNASGFDTSNNTQVRVVLRDKTVTSDYIILSTLIYPGSDSNKIAILKNMVRTFRFTR